MTKRSRSARSEPGWDLEESLWKRGYSPVVGIDEAGRGALAGPVVAAAVVLEPGTQLDLETLRSWCRDRLSHYRIPRRLMTVEQLPRNAMGKVTKPAVRQLFSSADM